MNKIETEKNKGVFENALVGGNVTATTYDLTSVEMSSTVCENVDFKIQTGSGSPLYSEIIQHAIWEEEIKRNIHNAYVAGDKERVWVLLEEWVNHE